MKLTAEQADSTVQLVRGSSSAPSPQLKVSYNNGSTWTPYTFSDLSGQVITLTNVGDTVCFAAADGITNSGTCGGTAANLATKFALSGRVAASGDISSLLKDDEENAKNIALSINCFARLFENATSLTEAPELSAKTINQRAY